MSLHNFFGAARNHVDPPLQNAVSQLLPRMTDQYPKSKMKSIYNSYDAPQSRLTPAKSQGGRVRNNKKFLQTLKTETYHAIEKEATQRGATVQELLRAVIIPEWLSEHRKEWGGK